MSIIRPPILASVLGGGGSSPPPPPPPPPYTAKAVEFATGSYLAPATGTAPADTPFFSFSGWFRWTQSFGVGDAIPFEFMNGNLELDEGVNVSSDIGFIYSDGINSIGIVALTGAVSPTVWYNIMGSVDTNHASGSRIISLYKNDVALTNAAGYPDTGSAFSLAFTSAANWRTGTFAPIGPSDSQPLDVADLWMAPGVFIDFTVTANRRKFIDGTGKPVDLGTNGQTPTGTSPYMFFSGDDTTFSTNLGTGGAFNLQISIQATGNNGAGPVSVPGAVIGQNVVDVYNASGNTFIAADFEATISVTDQIQQTSAEDLSAANLQVWLAGTITNAGTHP